MSVRLTAVMVARAQSGDLAAMDGVLRALQEPLYAHVLGITGDRELALDVMQHVLWRVARKLPTLRDPRWARAWAYRIATREAVRRSNAERPWRVALRDADADRELDQLAAAGDSSAPPPDAAWDGDLTARVDALPPACRTVIRLHYLDGLSIAEVAEALEIAIGTTKSRLAYGLRLLRTDAAVT